MSFRNPFGWDLPPGCTDKDIDDAMGGRMDECPDCEGAGTIPESNCCGATIIENTDICSKCKEHCEPQKCETCKGDGELDVSKKRPFEPDDD